MRKGLFLFLLLASVFMVSCDGILWTGQPSPSSDSLVLSINNPFGNDTSTSGGRALALQGNFLYIELARIDNAGTYTDPVSPFTTNGNWEEADWGGRAVLTFDLTDLGSITATFKDVPRDQDISARIILDPDSAAITTGLSGNYGEVPPICHTYNSSGADIFEQLWVTITSTELQQNTVSLPIRPNSFDYTITANTLSSINTEVYIEPIGTPTLQNTEPDPGNTKFSNIQIDLSNSTENLKDAAYYLALQSTNFAPGTILPGLFALYNEDGSIVSTIGGDTITSTPSYPYRSFYITYPVINSSYVNNDFFIGSTILPGPHFSKNSAIYNTSNTYDISYGIVYDISAYISTGSLYWQMPTGLSTSDFEFKVIYIDGSLVQSSTETLSQIYALSIDLESNWISGTSYTNAVCDDFSGATFIILARTAGATSANIFIFARVFVPVV